MARPPCSRALRLPPTANVPPFLLLFLLLLLAVSICPKILSPQSHPSSPLDTTCQTPTTPSTFAGVRFQSSLARPLMITRATEYNQLLIPFLGVVLWAQMSVDSQPTPMLIWPLPPTMVEVTICTQALAQSGDIAFTGVQSPTRCQELKRQISTDTLLLATARPLPTVHLCHIYSRREHPIRWIPRLCLSNIPRPYSPPDITMGCTPHHHARFPNQFRVHCPTQTSPLAIPQPLPQPLPRAPANHQSSCRLLSTATLSHPSQMPIKRRCLPMFRMVPLRPASVRSPLSPTASRASPVPSTRNPEASMSTQPVSIHIPDVNRSRRPVFSPCAANC